MSKHAQGWCGAGIRGRQARQWEWRQVKPGEQPFKQLLNMERHRYI